MTRIQIRPVLEHEKSVLRQLVELYEYDFSEFNHNDVNQNGLYGYKYFDHYWTDSGRFPFFVIVDEKLAGFVLVNDHCYLLKEENARSISEFFIMRKYRRAGIGSQVAFLTFDQFIGHWEVRVHPENHVSHIFWKEVIKNYTGDNYISKEIETEEWTATAFILSSGD